MLVAQVAFSAAARRQPSRRQPWWTGESPGDSPELRRLLAFSGRRWSSGGGLLGPLDGASQGRQCNVECLGDLP